MKPIWLGSIFELRLLQQSIKKDREQLQRWLVGHWLISCHPGARGHWEIIILCHWQGCNRDRIRWWFTLFCRHSGCGACVSVFEMVSSWDGESYVCQPPAPESLSNSTTHTHFIALLLSGLIYRHICHFSTWGNQSVICSMFSYVPCEGAFPLLNQNRQASPENTGLPCARQRSSLAAVKWPKWLDMERNLIH